MVLKSFACASICCTVLHRKARQATGEVELRSGGGTSESTPARSIFCRRAHLRLSSNHCDSIQTQRVLSPSTISIFACARSGLYVGCECTSKKIYSPRTLKALHTSQPSAKRSRWERWGRRRPWPASHAQLPPAHIARAVRLGQVGAGVLKRRTAARGQAPALASRPRPRAAIVAVFIGVASTEKQPLVVVVCLL